MSQHSFTHYPARPSRNRCCRLRPSIARLLLLRREVRRRRRRRGRGRFVYSNLNDLNLASCFGLSKSLDHFKGVLHELGLQVPASMFEQGELDMQGNVGNRCISHNEKCEFA